MGAFLGLSIWFALVTVIPGLVTLATVWGAAVAVGVAPPELLVSWGLADATLAVAVAVTVMLLTQWLGILLEEKVLVPRRLLGHRGRPAARLLKPGIDPLGRTEFTMDPYDEYAGLYLLLAELRQDDDVRGHLERAVTQFFLTINTMVAFALGIVAAIVLAVLEGGGTAMVRAGTYAAVLMVVVGASWLVAVSRFELMGWSLSASRRRRVRELPDAGPPPPGTSTP